MSILEAKPVFDDLLTAYGFRLAVEHYDHESFGSAFIDYTRRGLRVRVIWDGRDGLLSVSVAKVAAGKQVDKWSDLESLMHGRPMSCDEARAPGRLQQLRGVVDRYLAGLKTSSTAQAIRRNQREQVGRPPNNRLQATVGGLGGAGPARWAFAHRA